MDITTSCGSIPENLHQLVILTSSPEQTLGATPHMITVGISDTNSKTVSTGMSNLRCPESVLTKSAQVFHVTMQGTALTVKRVDNTVPGWKNVLRVQCYRTGSPSGTLY